MNVVFLRSLYVIKIRRRKKLNGNSISKQTIKGGANGAEMRKVIIYVGGIIKFYKILMDVSGHKVLEMINKHFSRSEIKQIVSFKDFLLNLKRFLLKKLIGY